MPVLNEKQIYELKWNYNHNLTRYYKGCQYLETHISETDKYIDELLNIKNNIEILLEEIKKYGNITDKEILRGFDIC